jgi:hypothetical protein
VGIENGSILDVLEPAVHVTDISHGSKVGVRPCSASKLFLSENG